MHIIVTTYVRKSSLTHHHWYLAADCPRTADDCLETLRIVDHHGCRCCLLVSFLLLHLPLPCLFFPHDLSWVLSVVMTLYSSSCQGAHCSSVTWPCRGFRVMSSQSMMLIGPGKEQNRFQISLGTLWTSEETSSNKLSCECNYRIHSISRSCPYNRPPRAIFNLKYVILLTAHSNQVTLNEFRLRANAILISIYSPQTNYKLHLSAKESIHIPNHCHNHSSPRLGHLSPIPFTFSHPLQNCWFFIEIAVIAALEK